jgi:tripartite-type tricarboxylate transporter receptor subunit TctC
MRIAFKTVLLAGILLSQICAAQEFPSKPVRIVVGAAPGGPIDVAARIVGQKLSELWQQSVVIDNRIGASEIIGAEFVAKSAPDGHVLLMASLNPFTINTAVFKKLPYDPVRGFSSIGLVSSNPMVLVANPKAPFGTVKELVAFAKSSPGQVSWATPGLATGNHIAGEWLAAELGISLVHIPYRGGPAAVNAVVAGEVPLGMVSIVQVLPLMKTGVVKVLGVTTGTRTALAPSWPALAELGVGGFDVAVRSALFGPSGMSKVLVARLNADLNRILQTPDIRDRFAILGAEPLGSTPDELDNAIARFRTKSGQIVEQAKIRAD